MIELSKNLDGVPLSAGGRKMQAAFGQHHRARTRLRIGMCCPNARSRRRIIRTRRLLGLQASVFKVRQPFSDPYANIAQVGVREIVAQLTGEVCWHSVRPCGLRARRRLRWVDQGVSTSITTCHIALLDGRSAGSLSILGCTWMRWLEDGCTLQATGVCRRAEPTLMERRRVMGRCTVGTLSPAERVDIPIYGCLAAEPGPPGPGRPAAV